jgi:hypothetical protein
MEIAKQNAPLEFKWKDITFQIRSTAMSGDKFAISMSSPIENGRQTFSLTAYYRKIIELFVIGWQGVTEDGKDVPFSLDALGRLPVDANNDVFILLASFILNNTGFSADAERKNA